MIELPVLNLDLKKIKHFNTTLDRQINAMMRPPLEARLQMRLIAVFNKYWIGKMDIGRFAKLWDRLIGPIATIQSYQFDQYLQDKDIEFIDDLVSSYQEPTIH